MFVVEDGLSVSYRDMADAARMLSAEAIENAKSGHPGMAMGVADVVTGLMLEGFVFNPLVPNWRNRDRLIFSAGHGVMICYVLMHLLGFERPTMDDLRSFRQLHSVTPGHPEFGIMPGIDATTGPLGQGFANAVGMAITEKIMKHRFGPELVDHKVFAVIGDGCIMEGISHEAASLAGHLGLDNLIAIFDSNEMTIDGSTSLVTSEDTAARFRSYGWRTIKIDGHDFAEISAAIKLARSSDAPMLVECATTIARGAGLKEGSSRSHGSSLGHVEVTQMREDMFYDKEPFSIPEEVRLKWRRGGLRSLGVYNQWLEEYNDHPRREEFDAACNLPSYALDTLYGQFLDARSNESTRMSSGKVIERIVRCNERFLISGSADLTDSNCVKSSDMKVITKGDFSGNFIHYGVREHAMAAIMNGISLYGGLVPCAGTFFVFSDYMRPAVRLSAMMRRQVIYIFTHDSIGVGEDGPTHQPIEHLASMRAMPGVFVFRPADSLETLVAWEMALSVRNAPSLIVLSRQTVAFIGRGSRGHMRRGAYEVLGYLADDLSCDVVIFASGSEVSLGVEAAELLVAGGLKVRVVSMLCWELFEQQDDEYKSSILDNGEAVRVAVEAGMRFGWDRYIGQDGIFVGMEDFGLSGPAGDLYSYFGITVDAIVAKVKSKLGR